jgi:uncharacterized protein YbjT (DUF2867 family)
MAKTKATPAPSAVTSDANGPVLVLGATGSLGQQLIQQLRQAKRAVRTYIRNVTEADEIELTGATVQIGSLIDQARLAKAVQGVSGILWAVGARPGMMPADIDMTEHKSLRALITVLEATGISVPLVVCSSMGTLDPMSIPPLAKILEAKRKAELALEDTKLPYTIVRPGGLTENPGGSGVLLASSLGTVGRIARADVATIMIAALEREDVRGKTFEIINREGAPAASDPKVFEGLK